MFFIYLSIYVYLLLCLDFSYCYSVILLSFISEGRQRLHIISGQSVHQLSDGWGERLCWQMSEGLRSSLSIRYLSFLHIRPFIRCFFLSVSLSSLFPSSLLTCTLSLCCGRVKRWECSAPSILLGATLWLVNNLALKLTRSPPMGL